MMTFLYLVIACVVFFPPYFYVKGIQSQRGKTPGLQNGQLQKCDQLSLTCICSEYPQDKLRYRPALDITDGRAAMQKAAQVIKSMGGVVLEQKDTYIASTFTSKLFKFVDDFEIRLDEPAKKLHIRSASRVGQHDAEANKKRVARFTQLFNNKG